MIPNPVGWLSQGEWVAVSCECQTIQGWGFIKGCWEPAQDRGTPFLRSQAQMPQAKLNLGSPFLQNMNLFPINSRFTDPAERQKCSCTFLFGKDGPKGSPREHPGEVTNPGKMAHPPSSVCQDTLPGALLPTEALRGTWVFSPGWQWLAGTQGHPKHPLCASLSQKTSHWLTAD